MIIAPIDPIKDGNRSEKGFQVFCCSKSFQILVFLSCQGEVMLISHSTRSLGPPLSLNTFVFTRKKSAQS
jgi:hypothetical protein